MGRTHRRPQRALEKQPPHMERTSNAYKSPTKDLVGRPDSLDEILMVFYYLRKEVFLVDQDVVSVLCRAGGQSIGVESRPSGSSG